MRRIILAIAFFAGAWSAPAQAEIRPGLDGFTAVAVTGQYRAEVVHGMGYAVEVTGPDAGSIRTEIDGGTLKIESTLRSWWGGQRRANALVRVTMPGVEAISASRGAEVNALDLNSGDLSLSASMGAQLSAQGMCEALRASVSMGASLNAGQIACQRVNVSASMGAEARVQATENVDASASMGASVRVTGDPSQRSTNASMGGTINIH